MTHSHASTLLILLALLAACGPFGPRSSRAAEQVNAAATQAAVMVETDLVRPTSTRTPTATEPAPTATDTPPAATVTAVQVASFTPGPSTTPGPEGIANLRVTPKPGLTLYVSPDIPDYVFQIDPTLWQKDPSGKTSNLAHKTIAGCQIQAVPGHGLGPPARLLWQDFGQFRWQVMDYGGTWAYVVPVSGASLEQGASFLQLEGYNRSACRADQEQVLADLLTRREATGEASVLPFLSPTPRPSLQGFSCPNTPPARVRVGDQVAVITDGLWLRSAPQADDSTKERKFNRYAPVLLRVINGPVCDKYVYWQVEISSFGEGSQTSQGWLAEGDPAEYYIMAVK